MAKKKALRFRAEDDRYDEGENWVRERGDRKRDKQGKRRIKEARRDKRRAQDGAWD